MPVDLTGLLDDLTAETAVVDGMVDPLPPDQLRRATPAEGWTIHDQLSHLAYFDEAATLALTDPARFRAEAGEITAMGTSFPDEVARRHRELDAATLLAWYRNARRTLLAAFRQHDGRTRVVEGKAGEVRVPWYGPDMSVASSVTARLMETWAHGQDIADALGVRREPTARLRHVAHLGVRTFGFAFQLNGREVPATPVRVELAAPDGSTWSWGPADAADTVRGSALGFCLAVTRRRHLNDLTLAIDGPVATEWMSIAQAYAGAPGPGRVPANSRWAAP